MQRLEIDYHDFVGIFLLLIINSTISFIEENNAGNAAAALMARLAPKAKVKSIALLSSENNMLHIMRFHLSFIFHHATFFLGFTWWNLEWTGRVFVGSGWYNQHQTWRYHSCRCTSSWGRPTENWSGFSCASVSSVWHIELAYTFFCWNEMKLFWYSFLQKKTFRTWSNDCIKKKYFAVSSYGGIVTCN